MANNSGNTGSSLIFPAGGPLTISAWINPWPSNMPSILGKIKHGQLQHLDRLIRMELLTAALPATSGVTMKTGAAASSVVTIN